MYRPQREVTLSPVCLLWNNYAARFLDSCSKLGSPLTPEQLGNCNFYVEYSDVSLFSGLLSELRLAKAFSAAQFRFCILPDIDRAGTVSIGKQLMRKTTCLSTVCFASVNAPCTIRLTNLPKDGSNSSQAQEDSEFRASVIHGKYTIEHMRRSDEMMKDLDIKQ